jgi:hypothetical protein
MVFWAYLGVTLGKMMMLLALVLCGLWPMAHGMTGFCRTLMVAQKS